MQPLESVDPFSANVWVDCTCGQRHWGRYGAAGLLIVHRPTPTTAVVVLQLRAGWTHHGGTWALPGGARSQGESAEDAALREAGEEAGLEPGQVRVVDQTGIDHGVWSYTYVLAEADTRLPLTAADRETDEIAWVSIDDVDGYPLHPHFADAWPALAARIRRS